MVSVASRTFTSSPHVCSPPFNNNRVKLKNLESVGSHSPDSRHWVRARIIARYCAIYLQVLIRLIARVSGWGRKRSESPTFKGSEGTPYIQVSPISCSTTGSWSRMDITSLTKLSKVEAKMVALGNSECNVVNVSITSDALGAPWKGCEDGQIG